MKKAISDPQLQDEILIKGYFNSPLLSEDEVNYLLKSFSNLNPDNNRTCSLNGFKVVTDFHYTWLDTNSEYRRVANNLIREVLSPHIEEIFVGYEILGGNFFIKPPNSGIIPPHVHPKLFLDTSYEPFNLWCPLVDTDEINGCLQVVEGSHHILPEPLNPLYPPAFESFNDTLFEKYMTLLPTKAGSCVVFDNTLIHGSQINQSSIPRIAIQVTCVPIDSEPVFFWGDISKPQEYLDIYEVGKEFYYNNSIMDLMKPPKDTKSTGRVRNTCHPISESAFVELLERGRKIRQKTSSKSEIVKSTFWKKIKNYFDS